MDDQLGRTLLALALHDEKVLDDLVGRSSAMPTSPANDTLPVVKVQLGTLICLGADLSTFQVFVDRGLAAGLEPDDVLDVLAAVAPLVGAPRVAASAAALARALGYDLDGALERHDVPELSSLFRPALTGDGAGMSPPSEASTPHNART